MLVGSMSAIPPSRSRSSSMFTSLSARLVLVCLLAPLASAQLREPGQPASFRAALPAEVPTLVFPVPDTKHLREASESGSSGRLEYGLELPVRLGLEGTG